MKKKLLLATKVLLMLFGFWVFVIYALPLFGLILNIGNIFGMALGILLMLVGIKLQLFVDLVVVAWRSKIGKILVSIFCVCVIAFLTLFGITMKSIIDYAKYTATDETTLVVLGCKVDGDRPSLMLKWRCDVATDYLISHPDAVAILSGGQGSDENISEADCMFDIITSNGISPDRLFVENTSTSTVENIKNSKEIIEQNNLSTNIAIATSDYHEKRASLIAKRFGFNSSSIPAYGDKFSRPTFFTREVFGVWMYYLT